MKVVIFCHSLVSDWNHGNAHFLRGVVTELQQRGHHVRVFEPHDAWSRENLVEQHGEGPVEEFARAFPHLSSTRYDLDRLDLDEALDGADLVLVHEWSEPRLVKRVGRHRAEGGTYRLLFHDTHHRAATAPAEMARFDLEHYDGVLAFGGVIRDLYLERGWAERAWTWHEAADTRVFRPPGEGIGPEATGPEGSGPAGTGRERPDAEGSGPAGTRPEGSGPAGTRPEGAGPKPENDLVWIGNWGDDERSQELREFLLTPARRLRLSGSIHGVRYPWQARVRIRLSGLRYRGWVANHKAPELFARHRLTVHVPRRPYVEKLPGIPTIRVFEALACGIPLVCAPWEDAEGLFRPGTDYLVARDGEEMRQAMREILEDPARAAELRERGLETIRARHTCAHRVDELLAVHEELTAVEARRVEAPR